MIGLMIAVVLALGVGGTVQVADNSRPGDALFGVDQAVENFQLKLAGEEKEARLRVKFAKERMEEIEEILSEEESDESAEEEGVEAQTTGAEKEKKSDASEDEQANIKLGVESALGLIAGFEAEVEEDAELKEIIEKLNGYLTQLPAGASAEIKGNKVRIEFKDETTGEETKIKYDLKNDTLKATEGEGRIKIEIKNGEVEIKGLVEVKEDDADDSDEDSDDSEDSDDEDDDSDDSDEDGEDDSDEDDDKDENSGKDDEDDDNSGSNSGSGN